MIFDRLLKKRNNQDCAQDTEAKKESPVVNEDTSDDEKSFKIRMFGLLLQALYNSTTVLKSVMSGDDYKIHGDPITSAIIDGDLLINTLKKMGMYARFTMKDFPDGSRGLKWINRAVVEGLRQDFYEMENIRDGKIFMLDEKIASLQNKLNKANAELLNTKNNSPDMKKKYNRAHDVFMECKGDVREALEHLKQASAEKDPSNISSQVRACLHSLRRALSYSIPEKYEEKTNNERTNNGNEEAREDGEDRGRTSEEEAEKAIEDYYNSVLQRSEGSEGSTECGTEGEDIKASGI